MTTPTRHRPASASASASASAGAGDTCAGSAPDGGRQEHLPGAATLSGPQLAAAYQTGLSLTELRERARIPRHRLREMLAESGVTIRRGRPPVPRQTGGPAERDLVAAYRAGATLQQLRAQARISQRRLRQILTDHGVTIRRGRRVQRPPAVAERDLVAAYQAGASLKTLAKRARLPESRVRTILQLHGVMIRRGRARAISTDVDATIIARYGARHSLRRIATDLKVSYGYVQTTLVAAGLLPAPAGHVQPLAAVIAQAALLRQAAGKTADPGHLLRCALTTLDTTSPATDPAQLLDAAAIYAARPGTDPAAKTAWARYVTHTAAALPADPPPGAPATIAAHCATALALLDTGFCRAADRRSATAVAACHPASPSDGDHRAARLAQLTRLIVLFTCGRSDTAQKFATEQQAWLAALPRTELVAFATDVFHGYLGRAAHHTTCRWPVTGQPDPSSWTPLLTHLFAEPPTHQRQP